MSAIGIKVKKATGDYDLGASKFFGSPTVPDGWEGKFYDTEMFFCQIRLSDLAEYDEENRLPHEGYLYVFLDIESYPFTPRVIYFNGQPSVVIDDFNEGTEGAERFIDAYLMSFTEVDDDAEGIKLFGSPCNWCYDDLVGLNDFSNYDDQPLKIFMQYDPLASEMGFRDNVDGFVYLAFPDGSDKLEDVIYLEERS